MEGVPGVQAALTPARRRYAFTVVANITVFGAAWLLLRLQGSAREGPPDEAGDHLGVQDVPVFRVSWGRGGPPRALRSSCGR